MPRKKRKYTSFHDFILNDTEFVMPFLFTLSIWFSVIIFSITTALSWIYDWDTFFKVLMIVMLIFSFRRMYKYFRYGGWKNIKGLSSNEVVWNKKDLGGK